MIDGHLLSQREKSSKLASKSNGNAKLIYGKRN